MSFNKSYIDQMKVMGALPYDTRLEQENAQLKARVHELDGELERHAWPYSLAMAEAKINQLNEEVAQLEAELAQAKRSYDAVAAHHEVKRQYRDLIEAHRRELAGWEAAHVALDRELAQCRQDLKDAAGELMVPMPEPGTDMAKLLSANVLLRQREARLREALKEIIEKCEDEDWEYMFGDIITRAKLALEETGT